MPSTRRQLLGAGAGLALATVAGCLGDDGDDDLAPPGDDDHTDDAHDDQTDDPGLDVGDEFVDEIGIYELQLYDRAHDPHEEISYMHEDHWHASGDFPTVPVDDNLSIGASAVDEEGNEVSLGDEYELKAGVAPGAPDIVSFDFHGDHIHIVGEEEGLTEIVVVLWHDDHIDYQSEPIAVTVGEADEEHDHTADGFFDEIGIGEFQLLDRAHDPHEEISYMDGDHWHAEASFPTIPVDDNLSIGAFVADEDGTELALPDEYELRAELVEGAEDIVWFDFHGDHLHVYGEEDGTIQIVFQLYHDDHVDYQTEALTVTVGEEDTAETFDAHHVSDVYILDRAPDPHEEVADWHDGHWHGSLPPVPVDDTISLGAIFEDENGYEAALSEDYELRVRLADEASQIVTFDFHGDHVHVIGEEAGETEVVFQLWHDDHADFETDPIEATVTGDTDDANGNHY